MIAFYCQKCSTAQAFHALARDNHIQSYEWTVDENNRSAGWVVWIYGMNMLVYWQRSNCYGRPRPDFLPPNWVQPDVSCVRIA